MNSPRSTHFRFALACVLVLHGSVSGQQPNSSPGEAVTSDADPAASLRAEDANTDELDKDITSPLRVAMREGDVERVRTLLDAGADPNRRYSDGLTPLTLAFVTGNADLVQAVLEAGADVTFAIWAVRDAVFEGNERVVRLLLEHGADPNEGPGSNSSPPILWAAWNDDITILKLLLDNEADPSATADEWSLYDSLQGEDQGWFAPDRFRSANTALQAAYMHRNLEAINLLLEAGADPDPPDRVGYTVLDFADMDGEDAIVSTLEAHGGTRSFKIDWRIGWLIYPALMLLALAPVFISHLGREKLDSARRTTFLFHTYLTLCAVTLATVPLIVLTGFEISILQAFVDDAPLHQEGPLTFSLFCAMYGYALVQFIVMVALSIQKPTGGTRIVSFIAAIFTNLSVVITLPVFFLIIVLRTPWG